MVREEFGDLQTPSFFTDSIVRLLADGGCDPEVVIEPTFGTGNFIWSCLDRFKGIQKIVGIELQRKYYDEVVKVLKGRLGDRFQEQVDLLNQSIFDIPRELFDQYRHKEVLIIGNPPWVTTSFLGTVSSNNLPEREASRLQESGIAKLTGSSNFDIAESIITFLINSFNGTRTTIAMLCKTTVNKKLLYNAPKYNWRIRSWRSMIISRKIFSIDVDACLLIIRLDPSATENVEMYRTTWQELSLSEQEKKNHPIGRTMGWVRQSRKKFFVSDVTSYLEVSYLERQKREKLWRQGVKHDLSKVLILRRCEESSTYINGLGEKVEVEDEIVYPFLKGSQVHNYPRIGEQTFLILPQVSTREDPENRLRDYPLARRYLEDHRQYFNARKSRVYRGTFSIFGIGEYALRPYKIGIAAMYKKLKFSLISPVEGKPVLLDDTSYYLSFQDRRQAEKYYDTLQLPEVEKFYGSVSFRTDKRPYKASVLNRLDIEQLM